MIGLHIVSTKCEIIIVLMELLGEKRICGKSTSYHVPRGILLVIISGASVRRGH